MKGGLIYGADIAVIQSRQDEIRETAKENPPGLPAIR